MECQIEATGFPNDMEPNLLHYSDILTPSINRNLVAQSSGSLMNPSENRGVEGEPGERNYGALEDLANAEAQVADEGVFHVQPFDLNELPLQEDGEEYHDFAAKRHCKEMSNSQRAHLASKLQQLMTNKCLPNQPLTSKCLPKGSINKLSQEFEVSRWSVGRVWKQVKEQIHLDQAIVVTHNRAGVVGRKRIQLDIDTLKSIPLHKRKTIVAAAKSMGLQKSTLHRMVKRGAIKKHTNAVKPDLTEMHRIARVRWVIMSIIPATIRTIPRFKLMYNLVHIDEKWFCLSKSSQRYYLAPGELGPHRKCKNKRFVKKVMFLAAVARPHIIEGSQQVIWDGKIGIWPFIDLVPAKKSSKNRPKGTIETKAKTSITKEVIKKMLIEDLLPAIRSKWPDYGCKTIWIQQDNARPHICQTDPEFNEEASKDGFDIHLINQPAQSPDLNILDLGFFRAIQSIKEQMTFKDEAKLVEAVKQAYAEYDPIHLNYIFLSLQNCMREILKCKGQNNYKLPHMNKEGLDREGKLPVTLEVDKELVDASIHWLEHGSDDEPMTDVEEEDLIMSEGDAGDEGDETDGETDSDAEV